MMEARAVSSPGGAALRPRPAQVLCHGRRWAPVGWTGRILLLGAVWLGGGAALASPTTEGPLVTSAAELEGALARIVSGAFPDRETEWSFTRDHPFQQGVQSPLRLLLPTQLAGGRNWFQLKGEGAAPQAYLLPIDIAWQDSVWVCRRALPAGHEIQPGDIARQWRTHTLARTGIERSRPPVGLCLRHGVRAGKILARDLLREPYLIERGMTVRMVYQSGTLTIATQAEALENGGLGDRIRVRPFDGQRVCEAVISAREEVEVTLP